MGDQNGKTGMYSKPEIMLKIEHGTISSG